MLTVNILPGSGLHLPEPPMLNVNVPTVCSLASRESVLAHLYLLYRISMPNAMTIQLSRRLSQPCESYSRRAIGPSTWAKALWLPPKGFIT